MTARTIGNFGDEVGNEKGGGCVRDVVSLEFEMAGHTHDSTILDVRSGQLSQLDLLTSKSTHVEKDLVNKLHGVAQEHDGYYSPVNLPANNLKVDRRGFVIQR